MVFRIRQAQVQISALSYPTPVNFSLSNTFTYRVVAKVNNYLHLIPCFIEFIIHYKFFNTITSTWAFNFTVIPLLRRYFGEYFDDDIEMLSFLKILDIQKIHLFSSYMNKLNSKQSN